QPAIFDREFQWDFPDLHPVIPAQRDGARERVVKEIDGVCRQTLACLTILSFVVLLCGKRFCLWRDELRQWSCLSQRCEIGSAQRCVDRDGQRHEHWTGMLEHSVCRGNLYLDVPVHVVTPGWETCSGREHIPTHEIQLGIAQDPRRAL